MPSSAGNVLISRKAPVADRGAADRVLASGAVGRVAIGSAGAGSYSCLPVLSRAVATERPGIELVLRGQTHAGEALGQIAGDTLDLGFVSLPVRRGITARVVRREPLLVALPDSHPPAARTDIPLTELAREPFVTFPASRGSAVREAMAQACHDAGFVPRIVQEAPDVYTLPALVGAGVGVDIVVASADAIRLDQVCFRPLAGPDVPVLPIALAWRTGNRSAALDAMLRVAERVLPTSAESDR
ncbi:LysR family substrate-binding domain-containing protein [Streptomyces griseochromogenes]|uniref:LysR family substrate-binding domain-containing protein n=1 Tax=Streptomyces griseochromogenes TaxID=68214 RepID=UPI0037926D73